MTDFVSSAGGVPALAAAAGLSSFVVVEQCLAALVGLHALLGPTRRVPW